jgi:hypothetical protein
MTDTKEVPQETIEIEGQAYILIPITCCQCNSRVEDVAVLVDGDTDGNINYTCSDCITKINGDK